MPSYFCLLLIEKDAKLVHGIDEAELVDAPTFADIYPRLKEVLENKLVVIYNASFDTSAIFNKKAEVRGQMAEGICPRTSRDQREQRV